MHILEDEFHRLLLKEASVFCRLINFTVDLFGFCLFFYLLGYVFGRYEVQLSFVKRPFEYFLFGHSRFAPIIMLSILYFIYMTLCEAVGSGRSFGKLITRSKAVRKDGRPFRWLDAARRSATRLIPFESISILTGGFWHDDWSNTRVVRT